MSDFTTLPSDIASTASQCDSTAQEVQGQLAAIRGFVEDLGTQWTGLSSATFGSLMTDFDVYAQMLNQALLGIANGLRGNWTNYTTNEETNMANLQQINGALPSTPGASVG